LLQLLEGCITANGVTYLGGHLPNFLWLQGPKKKLTVSTDESFESNFEGIYVCGQNAVDKKRVSTTIRRK
jgi:thioredoxin reductase